MFWSLFLDIRRIIMNGFIRFFVLALVCFMFIGVNPSFADGHEEGTTTDNGVGV